MPRKRECVITESLEELQRLQEQYRGKPEATRITVLMLLKQDDKVGIEEVATLVGFSKPTVKRWWRAYREGGLQAVLGLGAKRSARTDTGLTMLRQKLMAGEFTDLADVQEWLGGQQQIHPQKKLGRIASDLIMKPKPSQADDAGDSDEAFPFTSAQLLRFLSDLPLTPKLPVLVDSFRKVLQTLLGDVDRISISLNVHCDLLNPEQYSPDIVITQSNKGTKFINPLQKQSSAEDGSEHFARLLDNLRRQKFPFQHYHQPHSFVYYYGGSAYLGIMVLWRERTKPNVSKRTLYAMESMRSFMIFVLSDLVARHNMARPIEHAFDSALQGLMTETGLTMQERRIMILQLLGLSYEEVADTLNVSLNTVRYHLRSIYNKTGAHSQAELFAKYFTPRVDPQRPV